MHVPSSSYAAGHSTVQLVQLVIVAKSIPSVQKTQVVDPGSAAYPPAGQFSQEMDPGVGVNSPTAHSKQAVVPGSGLWNPDVHAEQLFGVDPYVPGSHAVQVALLLFSSSATLVTHSKRSPHSPEVVSSSERVLHRVREGCIQGESVSSRYVVVL